LNIVDLVIKPTAVRLNFIDFLVPDFCTIRRPFLRVQVALNRLDLAVPVP
jgi:hypothetical protein